MRTNIGNADRVIRLVFGVLLLSLLFLLEGPARWLGLLGIVLIGTALVRFCPAYGLFGMGTCRAEPPMPQHKQ